MIDHFLCVLYTVNGRIQISVAPNESQVFTNHKKIIILQHEKRFVDVSILLLIIEMYSQCRIKGAC